VDPGVDLHITQLIREEMVGTTWPRIRRHGHLLLMGQLNPTAKKGPEKDHAREPFM
jgi:hypothetical protein